MTLSCHGIGIAASREVAIGQAFLLQQSFLEVVPRTIPASEVENETARFNHALAHAKEELQRVHQHIPSDTAQDISSFIETHLLMMEDSAISKAPIALIQQKYFAAEWALQVRRDELVRVFDEMDDPYLRTRKDDVDHVVGQIQRALQGAGHPDKQSLRGRIIVSRDLTPSDIIMLKHQGVAAFVTEYGGPLSHTAILARSLGIPAILGIRHASQLLQQDEMLVVDGSQGIVLADPTGPILQHFHQRISQREAREAELRRGIDLPAVTLDGTQISLLANIELPDDIVTTLENRADGVGLFRTEFLYMNRTAPPEEEEQLDAYLDAVRGLQGRLLTIRTFDLGADKTLECNGIGYLPAANPALGLRAVRLCLKEPGLFLPQLRAILRASAEGPVRLMIPMLSSLAEVNEVLTIIEQTKQTLQKEELAFDPEIPVGGMIEIPAAAISAQAFARKLDFLSIGTNDLIQYTLAVDRMDEEVNYLFDPLHPAVLQLIALTISAAKQNNIPVSMCGEMAGDPLFTRLLLGMGLTELSMQPGALLESREVVRNSHLPELSKRAASFIERLDHEAPLTLFEELFS
ncbi:MAG: phosphoenolpyruvate-protein phosphotransferase [Gammaproteobacteria bacterium (ex Lamellibrachia satsuma)]|nr:MAG: phosphoenolpyruvate--protein phosphotransferase [Gammaproteobacteria bacterium (ex Lamellibrachia satsuma)]RRS33184.1 MAG: phosphoenolpyruvate-protein phosphotransferase [Gammaproteobacteria bacterium (ex Lamellibrachia satsuma)]RRS36329.1 MAG: phosphoenolpyruvate-protein phosphotransferase [Gammaproteobacteria bacterium (ex Lamellibrachia satsuma)]